MSLEFFIHYDPSYSLFCYQVERSVGRRTKGFCGGGLGKGHEALGSRPYFGSEIPKRSYSFASMPSRNDNAKPDGCVFIEALLSPHDSMVTEIIQISSEILIARSAAAHLTLEALRRYRFVSSYPLGVATPDEPLTPKIWVPTQKFFSFALGAFGLECCLVYMGNPLSSQRFALSWRPV